MAKLLKPSEIYSGKRILFTGATGFVGKVCLSMLLERFGDVIDRVDVLVRPGPSTTAERRFFDKVATSEPFEPLRARLGGESASLAYLEKKCRVLDGDITDPMLGLTPEQVAELKGRVDLILNCAGLVSFNPSLELGLRVNTGGVKNTVALCQELGDVPILHVSTAFVAGNRSGLVFEDEEVQGYFPRREELGGRDFSLEEELKDCERQVAQLRQQADDHTLTSNFREKAIARLQSEGRNADDEKTLRLALGRERKLWLAAELTRAGMERAAYWGWPNTYTYTKSLGEQVLASTPGIRYAIVRPSIVESAMSYPFPGWNEGFTTSAPMCFASLKGHRGVPAGERTVLDIIPVDQVAGAMLGIAAHTMTVRERRVYQLASGDENPFYASRSVELVGLYRRRYFKDRTKGSALLNELQARIEPQAISKRAFELRSAPMFKKGADFLKRAIADYKPKWGAPTLSAWLDKASDQLTGVEDQAASLMGMIEMFLPFIWENQYFFRCDNTRSVYANMDPVERALIPWDPKSIHWRTYFLEIHLPGLEKWVFPGLEEETKRRSTIPAHRDLLELLEAAVHAFRHRTALRWMEDDTEVRFSYGDLDRYASRVGSFLLRAGLKPQQRVLLASESRPEWAFAYFGILRAGGTVVPVDPDLSEAEVVNLARRSEATACLVSEEAAGSLPGLFHALATAGLPTQVHSLAQAMEGDPSQPNRIGAIKRSASPDDVASLLFTSGTTGNPKGVMLTHRNFTSLVSKLAGAFSVGVGDGLLSVLPLHHTFEFSCGLLTPLSRGADITYLDTLNSERLSDVFETGRITAMIGVPALWQLLHRKLTQELAAGPALVESAVKALMSVNSELRNRKGINLGKLLFWPVHKKFGGRLRFMVSGGAALSEEVHSAFHGLGFQLTEGYGLTEAAPVLTVAERENERRPGSVGRALPGIELRIEAPDGAGVGEVLARGPTVMAGYFGDADATAEAVQGGWLRTGDLGRLDEEGRLYLVGRKKDVIVDSNGKNVYPDELEELFGKHPLIEELCVVGLPDDASGERVACLCVPRYGNGTRPRAEVRHELEEHFRTVAAQQAFYRRIKVLHFWDGELPKTSTRKVKRKQVVEELKRLERAASSGHQARERRQDEGDAWLLTLVAEVAQRRPDEVHLGSRLGADLGFDSLMVTELSVALEQAGVPLPAIEDLSKLETVENLRQLVASQHRKPAAESRARDISHELAENAEIDVPESVASVGRSLLSLGQRLLYGGVFQVNVKGKSFIPQNRNCLVVANHASHLDMGLIKVVLGDQGERLAALAARDYFFDTAWKRAYFENFTNLIPIERHGSLRESLKMAGDALNQGLNLLIFPEGTRTTTGELQEFKATLGYLALTYQVDVLPLYLDGTFGALPKGALFPKQKQLDVRIGPVFTYQAMKRRTEGMSRSASYRLVTEVTEQAVRALKDGKVIDPSAAPSVAQTPEQPPKQLTASTPPHRSHRRHS